MIGKKIFGILVVIGIVAGLTSGAFAFDFKFKGTPPPSPEKFIERMAKDLGLSKEQTDKLTAGAKQVEEQAKEMRAKNKELFGQIEKELMKDSPDSKTIYGYMQEIGQNNTQIQFKRMEQIILLRKELNPEQKAKLEKFMQELKGRRNKMFGKRPGELGGPEGPGEPFGPDAPGSPESSVVSGQSFASVIK